MARIRAVVVAVGVGVVVVVVVVVVVAVAVAVGGVVAVGVVVVSIVDRLRARCDNAKRPVTFFAVADIRYLLDALEQAEADVLDVLARSDAAVRLFECIA